MDEGLDRHEAIHAIGLVLADFMHDLQKSAGIQYEPERSLFRRAGAAHGARLATIWVTAPAITAADAFKATAGRQPGLSFDCRAYQAGWRRRTIVSVMSQALRMLTIANSKRAPASAFNPKSFSR
jgi:hypothetical protein